MATKERKDGKVGVSFRIPIGVEQALTEYCAFKEHRIKKSDFIAKLICEFLAKEGYKV